MTSTLETVAAWPVGSAADKALQRTAVTKRFIWVFADTEDTQNFDVVDPADGTLPLYIQWNGILFQYDSTDTTTAHDGTTCAVTADAKRYKAVAAIPTPYSVLSTSTSAQPGSPTIGDTYYIPTAATGADWAGKDGQIGTYLARGWVFQAIRIGQFVYDESTDTYYHKTAGGSLAAGFGAQALLSGSVLPSMMSGGGGKVRWFVENQTTNTPPVSPSANVEYIIGSSPTGAWAGKAAQIARYENGAWTYYVPVAGWKAYDKALLTDYVFDGTAWSKASGNFKVVYHIYTSSSTFTKDAQCFGVRVYLVGPGGGGARYGGGASAGTATTFGSYASAPGGAAGTGSGSSFVGGAGGSPSGSAINIQGGSGTTGGATTGTAPGGVAGGKYGSAAWPAVPYGKGGTGDKGGSDANIGGGGGGGGATEDWFNASDITSTVAITIGTPGTASSPATAGYGGLAVVEEYIRI